MHIAFGCAILTLLAVGVVSYRALLAESERARWVRHTHEVLDNLKSLLSAIETMETNYQGFVLAGKAVYIEPYQADRVRVEQNGKTLRALTADDPNQQRWCTVLESWAAQNIQFGERAVSSTLLAIREYCRRTQLLAAGSQGRSFRDTPA
jgi:CHASE3 domain sensor protein